MGNKRNPLHDQIIRENEEQEKRQDIKNALVKIGIVLCFPLVFFLLLMVNLGTKKE